MRRTPRPAFLWMGAVPVLAALAVLASCASVPLPPGEGADLYRAKCGGCHRLYAPTEIREEGWQQRIELMSKRAKLGEQESARIRRYVDSNRAPSPRPPG